MSLLDILASSLGNSAQPNGQPGQPGQPGQTGQATLIAAALEFVNSQPGGIMGLIQRFHEHGAGDIVQSWIGTGENQPISPDTLTNVLGHDNVGALAQKAGVSGDQLSGMLAAVLPHVVDRATPNGEVPPEGKLDLTGVLGSLGGLAGLFGKSEEPKQG
ncbi:YidB family protein [Caballeronia sp. LZ034LL]|nr:YidB family protein [Caballeronia sp. LZ034LL]MDR5834132.1 YidB family protein [Caballeronia sp. LZ034LL]